MVSEDRNRVAGGGLKDQPGSPASAAIALADFRWEKNHVAQFSVKSARYVEIIRRRDTRQ